MTEIQTLVIYVSPPPNDRAPWRVKADGQPIRDMPDKQAAMRYADGAARVIETAGGNAVIKIEQPDGAWETYRV